MEKINAEELRKLVGDENVISSEDEVCIYAKDYTLDSIPMVCPEPAEGSVVVRARSAEMISKVVTYANEKNIPIVPRGGGTNVSAAAIVTQPSIIISFDKMTNILEIDEENMLLVCEPGVSLHQIIDTMNSHESLFFPLHPGDESAHVGGMVATNAGGVRAVRYGVMRDQVRGLEVVLPTGEIVRFGSSEGKLAKNNAGLDLMHLIIGSEGTLGIITRVVLRIFPKPKASGTLIISFASRSDAFRAANRIMREGFTPVGIEYVEKDQITKTAVSMSKTWPAKEGIADLLIMLSENSDEDIHNITLKIEELCSKFGAVDAIIADSRSKEREILEIRSGIYPAIEHEVCDLQDATVPRSNLLAMIEALDQISARYNTFIPVLAHAGDGNLHTFILKEDGKVPPYYEDLKNDLYSKAVELGGTITGEHGVGLMRVKHLHLQFSDREMELMRQIKKAFDPKNLLNPGVKLA